MDFNDTPEEAAWREEFRAWLEEHAPKVKGNRPEHDMEIGGGDYLERAKRWQAMKFDAGFARITWEPEFGGRNGTTVEQIVFGQEEARFTVPNEAFIIGLGMIAPTLRAVGNAAQQERYLTKLLRGEEIWSQLFSEPGAGSDVASLATTATRDGDEWVINGQKVWTSGAQFSDFGEIVCRTNPEAEKHKGITAFIVDMRAPGVTIKPLKQMNGGSGFNEVFFDDVRVPHENVLGDVNEGWTVAITTLMNERVAIGSGGGGGGRGSVQQVDLARAGARPRWRSPRPPAARRPLHEDAHPEVLVDAHAHRGDEGQDPRPRGIDRQAPRRPDHDPTRRSHRFARGRRRGRRQDRARSDDARRARRSHRGRFRRGHEEHHRRTRARAPRRAPPGQGNCLARRPSVRESLKVDTSFCRYPTEVRAQPR